MAFRFFSAEVPFLLPWYHATVKHPIILASMVMRYEIVNVLGSCHKRRSIICGWRFRKFLLIISLQLLDLVIEESRMKVGMHFT